MKLLDRLLGRLKPCGCRKPAHDGPAHTVAEAKFDSEMIDHGNVHERHDCVDFHVYCSSCEEPHFVRFEFDTLDSPHPDRREWTKTEMVKHENKMGEVHNKRKRTRHPDYAQCFNWSSWPLIKRMWRDGRGSEIARCEYRNWDGEVQTGMDLHDESVVEDTEEDNV